MDHETDDEEETEEGFVNATLQSHHATALPNRPALLFKLLTALPLRSDVAENESVVATLLTLLEVQDAEVLGNMYMNVPRLLDIIVTYTHMDGLNPEVR